MKPSLGQSAFDFLLNGLCSRTRVGRIANGPANHQIIRAIAKRRSWSTDALLIMAGRTSRADTRRYNAKISSQALAQYGCLLGRGHHPGAS